MNPSPAETTLPGGEDERRAQSLYLRIMFARRLTAKAPPGDAPAILWENPEGEVLRLATLDELKFGRHMELPGWTPDPRVSRDQFRIAGDLLTPGDARNPTEVNGTPCRTARFLNSGDIIGIPGQSFVFLGE